MAHRPTTTGEPERLGVVEAGGGEALEVLVDEEVVVEAGIADLHQGNPVSGWTTIVTAVLFFAGVNLISLGVVGEYVARIFDEVKGRPLFVVRRRQGQAARADKVAH